jgi:uncharacterized YigZ family protein
VSDVDTLLLPAQAEIEVKHSRFIAEVFPIASQIDAREMLKQQKKRYEAASHVVHAFIAGAKGEIRGMSDDGEPAGTAARPIMDILAGKNCTNILLSVTRYFGGTLLGTGGLVKAYGDAAKAALAVCRFEPLVEKCRFTFSIPYDAYAKTERFLPSAGAENVNAVFETDVTVTGTIPKNGWESLRAFISDLTAGKGEVKAGFTVCVAVFSAEIVTALSLLLL